MSAIDVREPSSPTNTFLLVPIFLLFVLLIVAVLRGPSLISNAGIGSAIIVSAPLILATYALTIIVMAGRVSVDLSIGPLLGFINVSMIQLFAADVITTPVHFFVYAIAVGIAYQFIMGLIIIYVRVQPIIVALSGYLALVGINLVILPRPGGVAPEWLMPWGLGTSILSPVLVILVLATIAWFLLTRTAFFGHLRLMGADERTAYTSGVRINIVRLGAHCIAGIYSALAALTFTALISSGDPTQGTTYTLMAVTALVLGGTSLAGGRGSIIGSLLGALNIYLITFVLSTFSFGMVQSFVTELAYGAVLVVSLLLTLILPRLPARVKGISPLAFFVVLGVVALGVVLHAKDEIVAPQVASASSGMTVLGGETDAAGESGLTVLGGDADTSSDSGLTVLGGETDETGDSGLTVLGGETDTAGESGLTVLGGDSGLTVLGGETGEAEDMGPTGMPLVYAAIIIAVIIFLLYLLYRHVSVSLVVFIGVLILLVLGLSLYDRVPTGTDGDQVAAVATSAAAVVADMPRVFVYEAGVGDGAMLGMAASLFASPIGFSVLVLAGTILFGSLLITIALPQVRAQIGNTPLLYLLALGVAATGIVIYANQGYLLSSDTFFNGAVGAVLVGALLFVVAVPRVQARMKNVSLVLLVLLSLIALGATYLVGGPGDGPVPAGVAAQAAGQPPATQVLSVQVQKVLLPDAFYAEILWAVLAGAALFIVTLPRVRAKILRYISFEQGVKVFSYTGGFIVLFSVLVLGALFVAGDVPLWRLGVAIVAAVVVGRFGWRFLQRYRGINGPAFAVGPRNVDRTV